MSLSNFFTAQFPHTHYCIVFIPRRAGVSKFGALFETLLQDPTQGCVEMFEEEHGVMIEIGDVTKRDPKG